MGVLRVRPVRAATITAAVLTAYAAGAVTVALTMHPAAETKAEPAPEPSEAAR